MIWLIVVAALAVMAAAAIVWSKGRPFTTGNVFIASRLSRGNRLFPTQVAITPTTVVQYTPRWIGRREETIHMQHVASVRIDTGVILSNILIETSGGSDPILCHGHRKGDAARMKDLIEKYQTDYYRGRGGASNPIPVEPGRIDR